MQIVCLLQVGMNVPYIHMVTGIWIQILVPV